MSKTRWLQFSFILVCIVAGILHHYQWISWDVSWLLEVTRRMFDGGQYGRDFIETNPPLILYIYSLPVWLSHYVSLADYSLARLEGYVIAACSLGLSFHLYRLIFTEKSRQLAWLFIVTLAFVFLVLPAGQFLQRENLLIMLSMPYLILVALRLKDVSPSGFVACTSGLLAAVAFAIKPYFFVLPIILELLVQWRKKGKIKLFRGENWMMAAIIVLYLLSIYWFFPSYFKLLFNLILPYYKYFAVMPLSVLIANYYVVLCVLVILICLFLKKHQTYPELVIVYAVAAMVSLLVYLFTGQEWYYHLLPMFSYSVVLLVLNLIAIHQTEWGKRMKPHWHYYVVVILIFCGMLISITNCGFQNAYAVGIKSDKNNSINQLIKYFSQNEISSVYTFSLHLQIITAADYSHVNYAGRFPNDWLVPYIVKARDSRDLDSLQQKKVHYAIKAYRNIVVADFTRQMPETVIIRNPDRDIYIIPHNFNYIDFLTKDPRFNQLWQAYRLDKTINGLRIYKLKSSTVNNKKI